MNLCLSLITGVDIPIPECQIVLHQPTIAEIALIGEKNFFTGAQCLCLNKSMYQGEGKEQLETVSNFQILISMLNEPRTADQKACVLQVLQLLFPEYKVLLTPRAIMLNLNTENFMIDESNFESFQTVCKQVFCLSKLGEEAYNPANKKAKEIADKIMRGRARVAAAKAANQEHSSVLANYISILSIGTHYPIKELINLTIFQLYDLIERYGLYLKWDISIKASMAGAKQDEKIEDWMKSIH